MTQIDPFFSEMEQFITHGRLAIAEGRELGILFQLLAGPESWPEPHRRNGTAQRGALQH